MRVFVLHHNMAEGQMSICKRKDGVESTFYQEAAADVINPFPSNWLMYSWEWSPVNSSAPQGPTSWYHHSHSERGIKTSAGNCEKRIPDRGSSQCKGQGWAQGHIQQRKEQQSRKSMVGAEGQRGEHSGRLACYYLIHNWTVPYSSNRTRPQGRYFKNQNQNQK